MLKRIAATTAFVSLVTLLSACAPAGGPPTPTPQNTPSGPQNSSEKAVDTARKDLAQSKGVPEDRINVIEVQQVDWNDTSLGCPEPDKMYAQVITPGYKIILTIDNDQYEYHSDLSGTRVVTCSAK